jgi:hypothetical protein
LILLLCVKFRLLAIQLYKYVACVLKSALAQSRAAPFFHITHPITNAQACPLLRAYAKPERMPLPGGRTMRGRQQAPS